jgi:hypothetical protein
VIHLVRLRRGAPDIGLRKTFCSWTRSTLCRFAENSDCATVPPHAEVQVVAKWAGGAGGSGLEFSCVRALHRARLQEVRSAGADIFRPMRGRIAGARAAIVVATQQPDCETAKPPCYLSGKP